MPWSLGPDEFAWVTASRSNKRGREPPWNSSVCAARNVCRTESGQNGPVKTRIAGRLASLLVTINAAAITLMVALAWNGPSLSGILVVGLWLLVTSLVGGAVAARRSSNPIGWLLLGTGLSIGLGLFAQEYAVFSLGERPGSLPLGRAMAWLSSWLTLPGFLAFALVLILFPSGRPPLRRWGPALVRAVITLSVIQALALAVMPGPIDGVALDGVALADNPLGLRGAEPGLEFVITISGTLLVSLALLGVVSRIVGFRTAPTEERQQIKWVVSAIGLLLVTFFGNIVGSSFLKGNGTAEDIVAFLIPMSPCY